MLALTDYARRVEGKPQDAAGHLAWGSQTVPFRLDDTNRVIVHDFKLTNSEPASLVLVNASTNQLFASLTVETRPAQAHLAPQDCGFAVQRSYQRIDDDNLLHDLQGLKVGDRVLVSLRVNAHEPMHYVAVDDPLPAILEAVNPEFKTREMRQANVSTDLGDGWMADFWEIRQDRFLSFADSLAAGTYTLRYQARVRAAGTVTAPNTKVEEMYHPDHYGLSDTQTLTSQPLE